LDVLGVRLRIRIFKNDPISVCFASTIVGGRLPFNVG
jgi:hypothetical protein